MLTLYWSLVLLSGIMVFAISKTEYMHSVAGLESISIGLMFFTMTIPLLMGYSYGARPAEPGWWQKVLHDVPPVVGAAPENVDREATPRKDAR